MPNRSYEKGYRFEKKIQRELEQYGRVDRAHQSGAWTGECDLKWLWDNRFWQIDCKCGKRWNAKQHRGRLENADICVDRGESRDIPLVILTLPKFLELIGARQP